MPRLALLAFLFATGLGAHAVLARDTAPKPQQVIARTILQTDVKGGVFEESVTQVYEFPPGAVLPSLMNAGASPGAQNPRSSRP